MYSENARPSLNDVIEVQHSLRIALDSEGCAQLLEVGIAILRSS